LLAGLHKEQTCVDLRKTRGWPHFMNISGHSTSKYPFKHDFRDLSTPFITIKWFGLEVTFKACLVQTACQGQGHLSLDQVAQSPVQPDPEHFQQ